MGVKERLTAYLEHIGVSKSEFGRRIGVSSAYVSSIRRSIDKEKLKSIALNFPDLSIDWLLYGEGEMLKAAKETNPSPKFPIPLFDCDYGDLLQSILEGEVSPFDYIYIPGLEAEGAIRLPSVSSILRKQSILYFFSKVNLKKDKIIWNDQYLVSYYKKKVDGHYELPLTVVAQLQKSNNSKMVCLVRPGIRMAGETPSEVSMDSIFAIAHIKARLIIFVQ